MIIVSIMMHGAPCISLLGLKCSPVPLLLQFVPGKVFLGGIGPQTTAESLKEYASRWGEVADIYLADKKGFAFVTFANPASAQSFLEQRSHELDGRVVESKAAVHKDQGAGRLTKKLFVGGIPQNVSDQQFREYFEQFGSVVEAKVVRTPDGTGRGYGFVVFDDEISVEKALVQENYFGDRCVDCKRAHAREKQQQGGYGNAMMSGGGWSQGGMDASAWGNTMGMYGAVPINPMMMGQMGDMYGSGGPRPRGTRKPRAQGVGVGMGGGNMMGGDNYMMDPQMIGSGGGWYGAGASQMGGGQMMTPQMMTPQIMGMMNPMMGMDPSMAPGVGKQQGYGRGGGRGGNGQNRFRPY